MYRLACCQPRIGTGRSTNGLHSLTFLEHHQRSFHRSHGLLTRLLFALSLLVLPPFQQMVCSLHFSLKRHSILLHFVLMLHLPELGWLQHFSVHKQELCHCCPFSLFLQLLKDVCPDVNQLSFYLRIPPCSCLPAFGRHQPPLSSLLPLHTTEKTSLTAIAVPVTVAIIVTAMVWSQWCHGMKHVACLWCDCTIAVNSVVVWPPPHQLQMSFFLSSAEATTTSKSTVAFCL